MSTVYDALIVPALKEIAVIGIGDTATSVDVSDALLALNRLLDQWASERLIIYTITRTTFTIVSGTQDYLVGPSQPVNIARPVYPQHVQFQDTAPTQVTEYQLTPLTDDAWANVPIKTLRSPFPTAWYWNPTYPYATISLWPVPTSSTLQGIVYAATAVPQFAATTETVTLPPGYSRALVKNLALEIAPSYEKEVPQILYQQASEAKTAIKRANVRIMDASMDAGALINGPGRFVYDINLGP